MRVRGVLVVSLVALAACSRAPEAAPPAQIQGSLNQIMRGVLFPNSNIIFDTQDKDPAAPPERADPPDFSKLYAEVYGGWEGVENAAIALYESANLLEVPGRVCQNGKPAPLDEETYRNGVSMLRETALYAYKTAQTKDLNAMLDVSDKLAQTCASCHDVYRDRLVDGKPIGMESRCAAQ